MKRYENYHSILRNKLDHNGTMDILADIVSIVARRGGLRAGHFVSYHCVSDQWYCNDDQRVMTRINYNPLRNPASFGALHHSETADLICFKNT